MRERERENVKCYVGGASNNNNSVIEEMGLVSNGVNN